MELHTAPPKPITTRSMRAVFVVLAIIREALSGITTVTTMVASAVPGAPSALVLAILLVGASHTDMEIPLVIHHSGDTILSFMILGTTHTAAGAGLTTAMAGAVIGAATIMATGTASGMVTITAAVPIGDGDGTTDPEHTTDIAAAASAAARLCRAEVRAEATTSPHYQDRPAEIIHVKALPAIYHL